MNHLFHNVGRAVFGFMALTGVLSLMAAPVIAQNSNQQYQANLSSLNDSGANATAWIEPTGSGNEAVVTVETSGLLEGSPHAQHIHFAADSNGVCPSSERADDSDREGSNDNIISVAEGKPDYGGVQVSLTTSGDTSADSALATDRFPNGNYSYERTVELTDPVANSLQDGNVVAVIHGIDINDNGSYDNEDGQGTSSLDESLPLEATAPAACGTFAATPSGGTATGNGSTTGIEHLGLIGVGVAAIMAGGGFYFWGRSSTTDGTE
jgi:hypothetical protein